MRELGLRAWSIKKRKFLNIDTLYCSDGKVCAIVDDGMVYDVEDVILEQYTGLKGKNGVKIYEGDIIHRGALSKANVFRNSVIRFDEKSVGFIATSTRNGARTLFNGHTRDEIEVIGNVHENPELLEDKR